MIPAIHSIRHAQRTILAGLCVVCMGWPLATSQTCIAADGAGVITVEVQVARPVSSWETKSTFSGIVKPKRKSELSFERAGRVDAIAVEQGDRVTEGQVLARLNTEQVAAQIRKLEADKRAAEAVLDELKAGPRIETIDAARAAVREQEVQWLLSKEVFARRQRLLAQRLIPKEEFEQAQSAVDRWDAARQAAQKRLEDIELGTRSEKLLSQQATIESLQAAIDAAQVDLDHSVIRSPYSGTIVARDIDEGYVVNSGRPVLTISEDSAMQAHFGIPPAAADALTIGNELTIVVRDRVIPAKLKSIVATVDESTRTQEIIATLQPTSEMKVTLGDAARLELSRVQSLEGFWLDTSAVVQGQRGLWECFVIEPDKKAETGITARRAIEILQTEGDRVLVRGALREGDRVVTSAVHRLSVGQRVRPVVKAAP